MTKQCDCLDQIEKKLEEHHKTKVELELKFYIKKDTMKMCAGLPPLNYKYKIGQKWKKSFVQFSFCPFCGVKCA